MVVAGSSSFVPWQVIILSLRSTSLPQPKATLDFLLLLNLLLSWCLPSQLPAPEHWGQECWSFLVALCPFALTLGPSAIHLGCGCTSHMKSLVSLWTTHAEVVPSLPSCLCRPAWMPLIHFPKQPANCPSFQKCEARDLIPLLQTSSDLSSRFE